MRSKDCVKCEKENYDKIIRAIENRKGQFADRYKSVYLNFLKTNISSKAVKAKCYDCITEDVHNSIIDCRGYSCPLYFVRPYQFKDTKKVKFEIKKHFKISCD